MFGDDGHQRSRCDHQLLRRHTQTETDAHPPTWTIITHPKSQRGFVILRYVWLLVRGSRRGDEKQSCVLKNQDKKSDERESKGRKEGRQLASQQTAHPEADTYPLG